MHFTNAKGILCDLSILCKVRNKIPAATTAGFSFVNILLFPKERQLNALFMLSEMW